MNLENSWKQGMHELVVAEVKGIGRRCCRPVYVADVISRTSFCVYTT